MNKILEELAKEADKFADDYLQTPGEFHPDYGVVRDQKFAELIKQAIYDEVKERPLYLVEKVLETSAPHSLSMEESSFVPKIVRI